MMSVAAEFGRRLARQSSVFSDRRLAGPAWALGALAVLGAVLGAAPSAWPDEPACPWRALSVEPRGLTASGDARVEVRLKAGAADCPPPQAVEYFGRLSPMGRFNQAPDPATAQTFFVKSAEPGAPLTVEAGGVHLVELSARVEQDGRVSWAQTGFLLFGTNEGGLTTPAPYALAASGGADSGPAAWPFLRFSTDGELYWPQAGHEFRLQAAPPQPGLAEVWEEVGAAPVALVEPDGQGVFAYVPPRDPELDRAGAVAAKMLVFVVKLADGAEFVYSLKIHRSRAAALNFAAGLGLFGGVLVLGLVALGRGRPPRCA
ncbi:MAG: hypothetical protein LBU12_05135 [Deltaproteobacteria bacterium]|jgi:hypothetical protein|nr:hypothetical protein [Deltaproteobacteria bacterium]